MCWRSLLALILHMKAPTAHPGGAGMGCGDGAQDRQPVRPARPVLGPQYDVVQLALACAGVVSFRNLSTTMGTLYGIN